MDQDSELAHMQGSHHMNFPDNPPHGIANNPRSAPVTQIGSSAEISFSPLMLQQMKSMIDVAMDGAIDRRLVAMGVNFTTLKSRTYPYPSEGDKRNNEKERQKYVTPPLCKSKSQKVIQDLTTRLLEI